MMMMLVMMIMIVMVLSFRVSLRDW